MMFIDGDRLKRCGTHEVPQNRVSDRPTCSEGGPGRAAFSRDVDSDDQDLPYREKAETRTSRWNSPKRSHLDRPPQGLVVFVWGHVREDACWREVSRGAERLVDLGGRGCRHGPGSRNTTDPRVVQDSPIGIGYGSSSRI